MRPNGRTIHKILTARRNRFNSGWGKRLHCKVRIPLSLLAPRPPLPKPEGEGWEPGSYSLWKRTTVLSENPRVTLEERVHFVEDLGVEPEGDVEDDRSTWAAFPTAYTYLDAKVRFDYYQLRLEVWKDLNADDPHRPMEPVSDADLPVEMSRAYGEYARWEKQEVQGEHSDYFEAWGLKSPVNPVLQAIHDARKYCATTYTSLTDTHLFVAYALKPWRRGDYRRFVSALKRAFRIAHAVGVDLRLHRGTN